jgi:hypothetical protein
MFNSCKEITDINIPVKDVNSFRNAITALINRVYV